MMGVYMRGESKYHRESGMASIMVTTVLMMVITLILIGFSQVARRNQQEALDRQLNTQAFYAAESGINAAMAVIKTKSGTEVPSKTQCDDFTNYPDVTLQGPDVKVTCMLVDSEVANIYYDEVSESAPTVVPVIPASGANIGQLVFTWRNNTSGPNASASCNSSTAPNYALPARGASWKCGHGMLRIDLSPQPTGSPSTAFTAFFHPHNRSGVTLTDGTVPPLDYSASKGGMVMGHCSDADNDSKCMAVIKGLNASAYYVNLRSIYRNSTVKITGYDTSGNPLKFKSQVLIDVTAKAQDVLKRIQVRVPVTPESTATIPAYAIDTTDSVCKRFSVFPGYYNEDRPCP